MIEEDLWVTSGIELRKVLPDAFNIDSTVLTAHCDCALLECDSRVKHYAYLLVDRPFYAINKQNEAALYLLYCLRYRGKFVFSERHPASGRGASTRERQAPNAVTSVYDTLLNLLSQYDASGRVEICRLLLERNSPIPLFLPNGQHHLPLFGLLTKDLGYNNTICVGQDTQVMRVAVISCREKKASNTADLLQRILHVNSLHKQDLAMKLVTKQTTTAEIGLGYVEDWSLEDPEKCKHGEQSDVDCNCPRKTQIHHFIVLHVLGDFAPLLPFIEAFADYLIVEDFVENESSFCDQRGSNLKFKGTVLIWKATAVALTSDWNINSNNGSDDFLYSMIQSPLNSELDDEITNDLLYVINNEKLSSHELLAEMQELSLVNSLRPLDLVPVDVDSEIAQVADFSRLIQCDFILQLSFGKEVEEEERKKLYLPSDAGRNDAEKKIQQERITRLKNAARVDSHVLIRLLKTILNLPTSSSRVLSTFQLEKSFALRSVVDISGLSDQVAKLYAAYTKNSDRETLKLYQGAKEKYNMAVVGIEHVWREMSHLYQADREKFSKIN